MPVFLTSLSSAQTLRTGSALKSSYAHRQSIHLPLFVLHIALRRGAGATHSDSNQQARALDLAHVRDAADIVGTEAAHDLPAGADDAHVTVEAAEKEAVGARAHARGLVTLEEGSRLVVAELDLCNVEEVEGFPL